MTEIFSRLLRFTWFPLKLQILTLGAFMLLIAGGLAAKKNSYFLV